MSLMFWSNGRRKANMNDLHRAAQILAGSTKADLLDACSSNYDRAMLCAEWAANARRAWYEGQRNQKLFVLRSHDARWESYGYNERLHIADRLWSTNPKSKELADVEQMYTRWSMHFAALSELRESSR
jgi:hypothetical protein